MRHVLISNKSMTNGEAIPISIIILLVIRILMSSVDGSSTSFYIRKTSLFNDTLIVREIITAFATIISSRIS